MCKKLISSHANLQINIRAQLRNMVVWWYALWYALRSFLKSS